MELKEKILLGVAAVGGAAVVVFLLTRARAEPPEHDVTIGIGLEGGANEVRVVGDNFDETFPGGVSGSTFTFKFPQGNIYEIYADGDRVTTIIWDGGMEFPVPVDREMGISILSVA